MRPAERDDNVLIPLRKISRKTVAAVARQQRGVPLGPFFAML